MSWTQRKLGGSDLTLTHCLSVHPTLWVPSSPCAVHLLCLGFGDLAWLLILAIVTDALVSSPVLMLFHIFTWKILVINGPGLARPREESGTKSTWPNIAGWRLREVCGCHHHTSSSSATLGVCGKERKGRDSVVKKGVLGGHVWDDGAEVRLLKPEAMHRQEGAVWVPGIHHGDSSKAELEGESLICVSVFITQQSVSAITLAFLLHPQSIPSSRQLHGSWGRKQMSFSKLSSNSCSESGCRWEEGDT